MWHEYIQFLQQKVIIYQMCNEFQFFPGISVPIKAILTVITHIKLKGFSSSYR